MLKNAIGLFVITLVVFIYFLPSYTKMQDLKQKNRDYGQQIMALKRQNEQLLEEKRLLETDPAYLEKVAREKMGLIREGEVVYKITPMNKEVKKK
ncbi:MAG: hypothetical protein A2787_06820 [Omnitrophica WOR_2 bacterium RIFCSPHIGHO2_01_FULL_48_9]|nr:MAG: hypothetical protein A2787_06820 [Omnitrophica WOR_2 bacterium RIFCSPHIGHO2_01_FULL_48_9]